MRPRGMPWKETGPFEERRRFVVGYPRIEFPVASTVGSFLRAKGLVAKRRRRAPSVGYGLSGCLANQLVGLEAVADGCWRVCFGPVTLGLLDARGSIKRDTRNFGLLTRMPNDARKRKSTVRCRMPD